MPENPGKPSFAQFGVHFGPFSGICLILTGFNSSSSIKITTFDLRSREIKGDVGPRPILGPFFPQYVRFFVYSYGDVGDEIGIRTFFYPYGDVCAGSILCPKGPG